MIYLVSFLKFCFLFFSPSDLLSCVTYTDLTYLVFLFVSVLFGDLMGWGHIFLQSVLTYFLNNLQY